MIAEVGPERQQVPVLAIMTSYHVRDVGGFGPPGDIHRVRNTDDTTAISIHIYGTDVTRLGSARRYYN